AGWADWVLACDMSSCCAAAEPSCTVPKHRLASRISAITRCRAAGAMGPSFILMVLSGQVHTAFRAARRRKRRERGELDHGFCWLRPLVEYSCHQERQRESALVLGAWDLNRPELAHMAADDELRVEQCEAAAPQPLDQVDQRDLAGVALAAEHAL